jgi:hypothetical protein
LHQADRLDGIDRENREDRAGYSWRGCPSQGDNVTGPESPCGEIRIGNDK